MGEIANESRVWRDKLRVICSLVVKLVAELYPAFALRWLSMILLDGGTLGSKPSTRGLGRVLREMLGSVK